MRFVTSAFGDVTGRRVKFLKLHQGLLIQMLRMDGSKAIRIIGMPADAQIVGMTDSTIHYYDDVQFVIESSEFPVVPPNSLIPDLILQCSSFDTPVAKAELEKLEK